MENLKKTAPHLADIPKGNKWKVPGGYFDTLSERISDKVHGEKKPAMVIGYFPRLSPRYIVISVFAIMFIIAGVYFIGHNNSSDAALSNAEILGNISENIYYYNEEIIIEALIVANDERNPEEAIGHKEIVDYLMYEDISEIDLMNDI
ncbi:MAG: hypothetical protein R6W78_19315 [Bacteroidales bacterium]